MTCTLERWIGFYFIDIRLRCINACTDGSGFAYGFGPKFNRPFQQQQQQQQ